MNTSSSKSVDQLSLSLSLWDSFLLLVDLKHFPSFHAQISSTLSSSLFKHPNIKKDRVVENRPLNFKGFHIVLRQWPRGLCIQEVPQLLNFLDINPWTATGDASKTECSKDMSGIGKSYTSKYFVVALRRYLRIKVKINVNKLTSAWRFWFISSQQNTNHNFLQVRAFVWILLLIWK